MSFSAVFEQILNSLSIVNDDDDDDDDDTVFMAEEDQLSNGDEIIVFDQIEGNNNDAEFIVYDSTERNNIATSGNEGVIVLDNKKQPTTYIEIETTSQGGSVDTETDSSTLVATLDLLSTPLSNDYVDEAYSTIKSLQAHCNNDYAQLCSGNQQNLNSNFIRNDFLSLFRDRRRLMENNIVKPEYEFSMTNFQDAVLTTPTRLLQTIKTIPHRGAHAHRVQKDPKRKESNEKHRENMETLESMRSSYNGNPNLTKTRDRLAMQKKRASISTNNRRQLRWDGPGGPHDPHGSHGPPPQKGPPGRSWQHPHAGDPRSTPLPPKESFKPSRSENEDEDEDSNGEEEEDEEEHWNEILEGYKEDNDYDGLLGFGDSGDQCMYKNWDSLSTSCQGSIQSMYEFRDDYFQNNKKLASSDPNKATGATIFIVLSISLFILVIKHHFKSKKIRKILDVIDANPELKSHVENMAGVTIPVHNEGAKTASQYCLQFMKYAGYAACLLFASLFLAITSFIFAGMILNEFTYTDHDTGEEHKPGPWICFFTWLITLILNTLVAIHISKKARKCCGRGVTEYSGVYSMNANSIGFLSNLTLSSHGSTTPTTATPVATSNNNNINNNNNNNNNNGNNGGFSGLWNGINPWNRASPSIDYHSLPSSEDSMMHNASEMTQVHSIPAPPVASPISSHTQPVYVAPIVLQQPNSQQATSPMHPHLASQGQGRRYSTGNGVAPVGRVTII
jgi:hypothetical protein